MATLQDTLEDIRRGVGDGLPDVLPVARGVVMGLGGSGIQTVSRVRSMVRSSMPEAGARSALSFLGVDAVDLGRQNPPLPTGVSLAESDFFNLTGTVFDASQIVASESHYDSPLQNWWDFNRQIAPGPQFDGLKQDRMLGRLAYYRSSDELVARIQQAFVSSGRVTDELVGAGQGASGSGGVQPRVYLATSMCGGTGSSGLLEAIYAIWTAAQGIGMSPEIRLFLYMPGVFESVVTNTSPNPALEIANLRANAYGFLRELDHFVNHSGDLPRHLSRAQDNPVRIPAGHLVKQVYLIDRQLSAGYFLTNIEDAYDVVASTIYQLLMTRVGQEVSVNGTNVDTLLQETDGHGKRRIYCGLSLAGITYPGETLRSHLTYRFADWVVRERLLARPVDLPELARRHTGTAGLLGAIAALHDSSVTFERTDQVRGFAQLCDAAPEDLAVDNLEESVSRLLATVRVGRPRAVAGLEEQLTTYRTRALSQLPGLVVKHVLDMGGSVPFGWHVLRHVAARLSELKQETESRRSTQQAAIQTGEQEVADAERVLSGKVGWRSWLGARDTAAKELGLAIQSYGKASLDQQVASSSVLFYASALDLVTALQRELEAAERALLHEADRFSKGWHADDLIGKDAGPRDLTALIPSDARPEVEESALAVSSFQRVLEVVSVLKPDELLKDLYASWRGAGAGRAAFDLGLNSAQLSTTSRTRLLAELEKLADRYAMQAGATTTDALGNPTTDQLYLPRSLDDAAARVDGGQCLEKALMSMQNLVGQVLLPVDVNKLRSPQRLSTSSTVVSRPASLARRVSALLPDIRGRKSYDWPDEERIQVLTTLWGASAHALTAVATWRPYYEKALKPDQHGLRKPPHLSRHWAHQLDPLEPVYSDESLAATTIVEALLVKRLLGSSEVQATVFGAAPGRDDVGVPLAPENIGGRSIAWHGTTFTQRAERPTWAARAQDFDFGSSYAQMVDEISLNPQFRQLTAEFADAVVEAAGLEAARNELKGLINELDALAQDHAEVPKEREALELLTETAHEMLADLRPVLGHRNP